MAAMTNLLKRPVSTSAEARLEADPMRGTRFNTLARRMRTIDRKTSLKMLGGAVATMAAARPLASDAGKNTKKCQKKAGKKFRQQVSPCKAHWAVHGCSYQFCQDHYHSCCEHLGTCRTAQYLACMNILPRP